MEPMRVLLIHFLEGMEERPRLFLKFSFRFCKAFGSTRRYWIIVQVECRAAMGNWGTLKAWAASWPFASGRPWAFWGGGGGGGGSEKQKKWGGSEATSFFLFLSFFSFSFCPPPSAPVSCLLIPLLCLRHPYSSPVGNS